MGALGLVVLLGGSIAACDDGLVTPARSSSSSGGSSSGSASGKSGKLRVANFNTRNLFNDKDDSDTLVAETIATTADYQKHLKDVASALEQLDADVVVLVEVENEAVLQDLIDHAEIEGKYSHVALLPGNDPRGINIGVVSKLPIDSSKSHREDQIRGDVQGRTYRYARDVPEYHLTKEGTPFTLLGVHFKAKVVTGTDAEIADDNDKRLAEARGARAIADSLLADEANGEVILLGDFNDDTESPSTQAVKGTDPEFGHAAGDRPEAERWTVQYAGSKMTYDDQWSSPGLSSRRQADSVTILRVAVSDHAAVAATYTLE